MLSATLLFVALLVNAFNRSGYRVLLCFIAIFVTVAHFITFNDAVSYNYYGTAAIASLVMILGASIFSNSPLSTDVQLINLAAIGVNMIGYYQYWAGIDPYFYNNAMVFLITVEFIRLMLRTNRDRIHDVLEAGTRHDDLRSYANSCDYADQGGYK